MLGDGVRVYHGTSFNVEAGGTVEIGDGSILAGAVFMCAERITLGRCVVASYNVTIADCDFHPLDPDLRRRDAVANAPQGDRRERPPLITAPVVIEDGAWIGIGAIVLKGVRIGDRARIGAGAVVTADVPPGATIAGNPGRLLAPRGLGMTVLDHDWYPAEVPPNVALGERSWLYSSFAFVHHRSERDPSVRIGADSGVYLGSCFDLGPEGEVEIGRYCAVAGAIFASNARIVIGDYAFISHTVVFADSFAAVPPDARRASGADARSRIAA